MIRYIYATLLILVCTLFSFSDLGASHSMGADLTYTQIGPNAYRIRLQFYRDCTGISPAGSYSISANSVSCGQSTSVTVFQQSFAEVSPLCSAQLPGSTCNGGALPGVQQYIYEGDITLPMACTDWRFAFTECCRNSGITTLSSPGSENLFVDATLNNLLAPNNSSPQFSSLPVPYICAGQSYVYNHGGVDANGDSLVYSLLNAQNASGSSVAYAGGFSGLNPMTSAPPVSINTTNGNVTLNPTVPQNCVLAVRVLEYRNGTVIGSTTRDIQVVVLNCSNNAPAINAVSGVVNGVQTGPYAISVCPGQALSFTVPGTDADGAQLITWSWNSGIAGASFTTPTGASPQNATFSWTPTLLDVGLHSLVVTLRDNACPVLGQQIRAIDITVLDGTDAGPNLVYCTGGGPAQLSVSGGTSFTWNVLSGTAGSLSCTNCAGPTATPLVPTTYQVVSNLPGTCKNRDTVVVTPVPTFTVAMGGPQTICTGGTTSLSAVPSPVGSYTYQWSPTTGLSSSTVANPTCTPTSTTTYNVTVTSAAGCRITGSQTITVSTAVLSLAPTASPTQSCSGAPVTLTSNVVSGDCNNYTVTSVPFAPVAPGGTALVLGDDQLSAAVPIGFSFTFYCNTFTNAFISSNGFISFDAGATSGAGSQLIPNVLVPNNVIAAGWHDLYPPGAGTITYQTTGLAPNRRFIVDYAGIPFCCGTTPAVTTQIILYETTNYIEIHSTNIDNISPGTMGIENSTGAIALAAPLRNNSNWTATNDAYRFAPVPPVPYTVNWQAPLGTTVATGTSVAVTPLSNTTYFAVASNGVCGATSSVAVSVSSVDAGPDINVCPSGNNASLNVTYAGPPPPSNCNAYDVSAIPFAPNSIVGATNLTLADDALSAALPLGFTFNFFCVDYTSVFVSSNGFISFTSNGSGPGTQLVPTASVPNNVIAVSWRDMFPPGILNSVRYQALGIAPNRRFVVYYEGTPWCCSSTPAVFAQIILYEGSNFIELHNTSVPPIANVTQGIENATGTIGFAVPGRNRTVFTATNDAFRFSPQVASLTYNWSPATFLSSTTVANPSANGVTSLTNYTVTVNNGTCTMTDNITVTVCLPVDNLQFDAEMAGQRVKLHWEALNEQSLRHYVIERSSDGAKWTDIATVQAIGQQGVTQGYETYDETPMAGANHYRLRMLDFDGAMSHSNTAEVFFRTDEWVNVAPNPSRNMFNFEVGKLDAGDLKIDIYSAEGKLLNSVHEADSPAGVRHLSVDLRDLPAGVYLYRVRTGKQDFNGRLLKID